MSAVLDTSPNPAATAPGGLLPIRGNAVLARYGDLTLVCEADPSHQHRVGALLDAVAMIAAGQADGRQLSHQVAGMISAAAPDADDFPALCAFGPAGEGMAVVVHGAAELIITANGEQVRLDGRQAVTVLDRVITDRVEAVRAVVGDTDLGTLDGAAPAPEFDSPPDADTPALSASDTAPTLEQPAAEVPGVHCARNHFNDPAVAYCSVCGISMAQAPRSPDWGPRPQLGVLVLDDGTTVPLLRDVLIGRMPETDEAVTTGQAEPVALADPLVSRRHARIALSGWQVTVTDLGSANGTFVLPRDTATWTRLEPGVETMLEPGSMVAAGMRQIHYYSHRHR